MAQKIVLIDDLDGSDASETVEFALDGVSYEIDLNDVHAKELREVFAAYVDKGRKSGRSARRSATSAAAKAPAGGGSRGKGNSAAVRAWALANGFELSSRGVIPKHIKDAYAAAH